MTEKNSTNNNLKEEVETVTTDRIIETIIPPEHAEVRLDNYLSRRFNYLSRNQWQKTIKRGEILLNNKKTRSARILHANDVIKYITNYIEPAVEMNYNIAFEDDYLLIVDKGGNLPCHPAGPFFKNTLWYDLEQRYGKKSLFLVNRLDRETSGLMVLAKSSELANLMSEKFKTREIHKEYLAIVHNKFVENIDANGFLFSDINSEVRKKRHFSFNAPLDADLVTETAHTKFSLKQQFNNYSLVKATLYTGRMHQIRATIFSLGYPLVGDKLYGLDDTLFLRFANGELTTADYKTLILNRQALHSWKLEFKHPITEKDILLTAPLHEDMRNFLAIL